MRVEPGRNDVFVSFDLLETAESRDAHEPSSVQVLARLSAGRSTSNGTQAPLDVVGLHEIDMTNLDTITQGQTAVPPGGGGGAGSAVLIIFLLLLLVGGGAAAYKFRSKWVHLVPKKMPKMPKMGASPGKRYRTQIDVGSTTAPLGMCTAPLGAAPQLTSTTQPTPLLDPSAIVVSPLGAAAGGVEATSYAPPTVPAEQGPDATPPATKNSAALQRARSANTGSGGPNAGSSC